MPAVAGRRRLSSVPGMFTRAQLEADLGVTTNTLDTLERQGVITASERRRPGDTRPVLFSPTDVAVARFAQSARRFGLRGEQLRDIASRLAAKRRRLVPGWSGWVLVDGDGDVELVASGASIDRVIAEDPRSVLVVKLDVPGETAGPDEEGGTPDITSVA